MKTLKNLALFIIISSFIACSSTANFPVSQVTPAAKLSVKTKGGRNENVSIEVKATQLASPDRIQPPKRVYVVWGVTNENEIKNLGRLELNNSGKGELNTVSPFRIKQIIITAEDEGNLQSPRGVEISRVNI